MSRKEHNESRSNSGHLSIVALLASILGIITCGILAPISLILAIAGVVREKSTISLFAFCLSLIGAFLFYLTWFLWPIGPSAVQTFLPWSPYNKYARNLQASAPLGDTLSKEGFANTLKNGDEVIPDKEAIDIWGKAFRVRRDGTPTSPRCTLFSIGEDGVSGTKDDLFLWDIIKNRPIPFQEGN